MIVKIYKGDNKKLIKFLTEEISFLPYSSIMKILRKKDVKVNGKRVSDNVTICDGDEIQIFVPQNRIEQRKNIPIVYNDENIVIVNKPRDVEVESETGEDLVSILSLQIGTQVKACHRIDRNTKGLVVFAKNDKAYNSLLDAFKKRKLEKFYKASVFGKPKNEEKLIAYLKKDSKQSQVYISDKKQDGYVKIQTNYKLIETNEEISILEVELITGKTHQIRAHLAHVGLPIVGDEKYGDNEKNKIYKKKKQELEAYKMVFKLDKGNVLEYLNNLKFEI